MVEDSLHWPIYHKDRNWFEKNIHLCLEELPPLPYLLPQRCLDQLGYSRSSRVRLKQEGWWSRPHSEDHSRPIAHRHFLCTRKTEPRPTAPMVSSPEDLQNPSRYCQGEGRQLRQTPPPYAPTKILDPLLARAAHLTMMHRLTHKRTYILYLSRAGMTIEIYPKIAPFMLGMLAVQT